MPSIATQTNESSFSCSFGNRECSEFKEYVIIPSKEPFKGVDLWFRDRPRARSCQTEELMFKDPATQTADVQHPASRPLRIRNIEILDRNNKIDVSSCMEKKRRRSQPYELTESMIRARRSSRVTTNFFESLNFESINITERPSTSKVMEDEGELDQASSEESSKNPALSNASPYRSNDVYDEVFINKLWEEYQCHSVGGKDVVDVFGRGPCK